MSNNKPKGKEPIYASYLIGYIFVHMRPSEYFRFVVVLDHMLINIFFFDNKEKLKKSRSKKHQRIRDVVNRWIFDIHGMYPSSESLNDTVFQVRQMSGVCNENTEFIYGVGSLLTMECTKSALATIESYDTFFSDAEKDLLNGWVEELRKLLTDKAPDECAGRSCTFEQINAMQKKQQVVE